MPKSKDKKETTYKKRVKYQKPEEPEMPIRSCMELGKTQKIGDRIFTNPSIKGCAVFDGDNKSAIAHNVDYEQSNVPSELQRFKADKRKSLEMVTLNNKGQPTYLACGSIFNKNDTDSIKRSIKGKSAYCGRNTPLIIKGEEYVGFQHRDQVGFSSYQRLAKKEDYEEVSGSKMTKNDLGKFLKLSPDEINKSSRPQLIMKYLGKKGKTTDTIISDFWEG